MSLDIVDDLHAAEDYGESMRQNFLRVSKQLHVERLSAPFTRRGLHRFPFDTCPSPDCAQNRADAYRFERPGCDEDRDETCGGYHPEREDGPG